MAKIQLCSTSYKWSVQFVHRKIALTGLSIVEIGEVTHGYDIVTGHTGKAHA